MKMCLRAMTSVVAGLCLCSFALTQIRSQVPSTAQKETKMTHHATGTFEVKLTPQASDGKTVIGRMTLDKQFHGDLDGTSRGEMLALRTADNTSGGYVAMEQVTATLNGRAGTFALQHTGTMTRGAQQLSITVVPDSGTEQLVGLAGTMTIKIEGGKHFYDFEYTLEDAH
jgi:hypothetical protein